LEDLATPLQGPLIWVLLIFSIWMLSDAIRRRAGWFWYIVILAAPLGAVIYFVAVKLRLSGRSSDSTLATPGSSMPASNRKLSSTVLSSQLDRADQLEAADHYDEAIPIYEEALKRDPNCLRAQHGMARCELGLGHPRAAVTLLEKVMSADREFGNFGAALDYADALWLAGERQDTLDLLRGLVSTTGRMNHRLALAHYLAENGDTTDAQSEAQRVLQDHASLSADEQMRQLRWRERATQMLGEWQKP
jgi:hypothetical protein